MADVAYQAYPGCQSVFQTNLQKSGFVVHCRMSMWGKELMKNQTLAKLACHSKSQKHAENNAQHLSCSADPLRHVLTSHEPYFHEFGVELITRARSCFSLRRIVMHSPVSTKPHSFAGVCIFLFQGLPTQAIL